MPRIIYADGPQPCRYLLVGERPGSDEWEARRNFVGPAGQELWARIWRILHMDRSQFRVANLVPTFSVKPPTAGEIRRWHYLIRGEVLKTKPEFIITVGYHAARFFLPQFRDVVGDYFHGLAFPFHYGALTPRLAHVVPVVHSSAALREPERYQNQLTEDLRAVGAALRGELGAHGVRQLAPLQVGLAGFGKPGLTLGVDTEGSTEAPECVTLAENPKEAACVEVRPQTTAGVYVKEDIEHAKAVAIHNAVHDWQVLSTLNVDLSRTRVHCTQLQAYLLGHPQSLKVLAFRLLGYQMSEYEDLVRPLDAQLVRTHLQEFHNAHDQTYSDPAHPGAKPRAANPRRARSRHDADDGRPARSDAADRGLGRGGDRGHPQTEVPRRALTSIRGILTKEADRTPRQRWEGSKFAPLVQLPPEPTWKDVPQEVRRPYAMADAVAHLAAHQLQMPMIKAQGLSQVYAIDRSQLPILARMEQVGMACDEGVLAALSTEFGTEFDTAVRRIARRAGHPVNPLSGEQVSDCLFLELGITKTKPTKSHKHYTTEDKYLKARRTQHRIINDILLARQLNKYKGTYVDKLPGLLREGRYHPHWKYTRTATGRLAEEIILLIPKHTERGLRIRNAFHATQGNRLVSVDLSQIELRCMAHLSRDKGLLDAFRRGEDLHAKVAHEVLGAPRGKENQDEHKHRWPSKTFNFSIINGTTEFGILDQLHEQGLLSWTIEQVREFLREWFRVYKGVREYWDTQKAMARRLGYVRDLFGRRRWLTAIWSTNPWIVADAERQTLCPIQATADGISKIWNRRLWTYVWKPAGGTYYCEPWVRVHDDTTYEVSRTQAKAVGRRMMELVPDLLSIPTESELKIGRQWGSLH